MDNKNFKIVVLVLILTCIFCNFFYFSVHNGRAEVKKLINFPDTVGEWFSEKAQSSNSFYGLSESENIVDRDYKNRKGEVINLCIIYSRDNLKITPAPEIILSDEGSTITDKLPLQQVTGTINATELITEKGTTWELVVFWYRIGRKNTNIYLPKIIIDRILGRKQPIALIKVSTEIDDKREVVLHRIKEFCVLLEPLLEKYVSE